MVTATILARGTCAEELANWLGSSQAYVPKPENVRQIETHISRIFIAGDFGYKLKQPFKYDFLDFSSLEARERACRDEARLNRQLTKDIYLGVVPVTQRLDGHFSLGGDSHIVEWLVKMRKLPKDKMLDAMQRTGSLRPYHINRLTELLTRFYSGAVPAKMTTEAYRRRLLSHVHGNRRELLQATRFLSKPAVGRVTRFQLQMLQLHLKLFYRRVHSGRVVEGHGDLHTEHICLDDPIAIFDCIEFNDEFRQLDIADELAFLAAECDCLGAAWIKPRLFHRYQQLGGDYPPPILIDFYKSYRATVRAKVAALRANQLSDLAEENALQDAIADEHGLANMKKLVGRGMKSNVPPTNRGNADHHSAGSCKPVAKDRIPNSRRTSWRQRNGYVDASI